MNRIDRLFSEKDSDILNIYFTAGYPQRDDTERIIYALDAVGVDLIEVGMPYSDPLADGETIQQSGTQAIRNGMTVERLFDQLARVRQRTQLPLVLMGYVNQMLQYGDDRFLQRCVEVGVDGLILPDLPIFEYERDYQDRFEQLELNISFLVTPQTSEERIRKVDELTRGFIYLVSSASITGGKTGMTDAQLAYFERIRAMELEHPCLIGFGISNHESYRTACQYAQGAIIGSAFIRALDGAEDVEAATRLFVRRVRNEEE